MNGPRFVCRCQIASYRSRSAKPGGRPGSACTTASTIGEYSGCGSGHTSGLNPVIRIAVLTLNSAAPQLRYSALARGSAVHRVRSWSARTSSKSSPAATNCHGWVLWMEGAAHAASTTRRRMPSLARIFSMTAPPSALLSAEVTAMPRRIVGAMAAVGQMLQSDSRGTTRPPSIPGNGPLVLRCGLMWPPPGLSR